MGKLPVIIIFISFLIAGCDNDTSFDVDNVCSQICTDNPYSCLANYCNDWALKHFRKQPDFNGINELLDDAKDWNIRYFNYYKKWIDNKNNQSKD